MQRKPLDGFRQGQEQFLLRFAKITLATLRRMS